MIKNNELKTLFLQDDACCPHVEPINIRIPITDYRVEPEVWKHTLKYYRAHATEKEGNSKTVEEQTVFQAVSVTKTDQYALL